VKRYALPYVLRVRDPGLHHLLLFVIKHSEDFWQFRSYNSEEIQRGHHVHWCVRSRAIRYAVSGDPLIAKIDSKLREVRSMQKLAEKLHTFADATTLLMIIASIALAAWLLAHSG
jgi:hypothetical protein